MLAATVTLLPQVALACASCGCTLNTDAATGYTAGSGWRINVDYTYIDQSQLRHGSSKASAEQAVNQPSDPSLGGGEVEKRTVNRYVNVGATYGFNANWNVTFVLPYVIRDHDTYGTQMAPYNASQTAPDQISSARVTSLGDVRILGNYQGFLPMHNLGVQFGIKLPTGRYGGEADNGDIVGHPTMFRSGPSVGQSLDSNLQAGTGSTDLIVGAYYYQPVSQNFDMFVNGQFQAAVSEAMDQPGANFRPGDLASTSIGLRYEAHERWKPEIQLNWLHRASDRGALADTANTAGTLLYLSPGINTVVTQKIQLYAFAQVPVYSHLQGYQLIPRWTATLGMSIQI